MDLVGSTEDAMGYIEDLASQFGLPFDPNPMHSPYVQSLAPQAPATGTAPKTGAGYPSMLDQPLIFGITQRHILIGGGILLLVKAVKEFSH